MKKPKIRNFIKNHLITMFNIIKKVIKYCIIIGLVYLAILYNFEANATYYYKHSALTNKNGTPFVLLDHLWWYHPKEYDEEGNYLYQLDGIASVGFLNDINNQYYSFSQSTGFQEYYELVIYTAETQSLHYGFNKNFKLISIRYYLGDSLPITKKEEQRARKAIEETTKQLMKEVELPLTNLQWLYDWTYHLRHGK